MSDVCKTESLEFIRTVANHLLVGGIGGKETAVQVCQGDPDSGVFEHGAPPFLAFLETRFRSFSILTNASDLQRIAFLAKMRKIKMRLYSREELAGAKRLS